jgi:uncharacterized protein DUF3987
MALCRNGNDDDHDDEDDDDVVDPLVAMVRSDPRSRFYDPRHARPIATVSRAGDPPGGWGDFDASYLDESRAPVPAFPLDVLPSPWRDWVRETAQAAAAPADYVALSLIAAVGGLCGAGVRVQVAPGWVEPLALWHALIGAASSGKSPAIAPLRALLAALAQERGGDGAPSPVPENPLPGLGDIAAADATGALLWCDEPADWLARMAAASGSARGHLLRAWSAAAGEPVVGLLVCLQPEAMPLMAKNGVELAARFLFSWPHPPPYHPLVGRTQANDDMALAALRRLLQMAATAGAPTTLRVEDDALPALDCFLATLHVDVADAEGLDQAWQGKGRGTLVRLIGCLALLDWSVGSTDAPGPVGRRTVEQGIALWTDYLRPHARAVLQLAMPNDIDRKARKVARWLRSRGTAEVSREEIRCDALSRSVNAAGVDRILQRLLSAGMVKQLLYAMPSQGGRPPSRWQVNPHLIAAGNAGNAGNLRVGR